MKAANKETKIEPPQWSAELPAMALDEVRFRAKDDFQRGSASGITIDEQEAHKVSFEQFMFRQVTFTSCSFTGMELTDVVFDSCDLSNTVLTESFLHRTVFRNCKLIGTDFTGSKFRNVRFRDCVGDYASFRFADFRQAAFERCSLVGADYFHAGLGKTVFSVCRIDQANMAGTKLEGIDLSDCEFAGIKVDIDNVKGCIVSAQQAASFVGLLGVVVK
ncbi:MAG: pentapeptide repeat-containing protein [Paenibacillaceae bacterium]|nr:pentapeptide repeat-containing protein [Paenibacillaceae bacterium]